MVKKAICVAALTLALSSIVLAVEKKVIAPPGTQPNGRFSPGLLVGDTLYVSGMVGRTKDGKVPEKFEDEVQATFDNINEVMKIAGMSFANAVAVQVYLTDMELFDRMNAVYVKNVPDPRPTRTTVGVSKLVGTSKIEITVTARK